MSSRSNEKVVTIHDVAQASNVSIATVSYVINNGPRNVRPETRKRVLEAIERLRYRPNALARSLVSRRTDTIGLISNKFSGRTLLTYGYSLTIVEGILDAAETNSYNVLMFTQAWKNREESEAWISERKTDGLVVLAPSIDTDMVTVLRDMQIPIIGIGVDSQRLGIPTVDNDNVAGTQMAVGHLIDLGHRRIAHLAGTMTQASAHVRRDAFIDVLQKHDIPVLDDYTIVTGYEGDCAYADTEHLLSLPHRPTAIFAANDIIASAAIRAVEGNGLRVPQDVSVIGYDNSLINPIVHMQMTTINQPTFEIGRVATELLVRQMAGGDAEVKTTYLTPEFIDRGTTAPPRP